ncbi:heparinase II/III-family protein [Candidatus Pelagibacter sp.]|nr:heparinase II/III-family protein [Candidatus Pelagibacter sp.]
MYLKNSLILINEFFYSSKSQIRNLYLKSSFYNNKISKIEISNITYRPTLSILSCLVKYDKKKIKIEELDEDNIWENELLSSNNFYKLNNFYWLFSIDLKSSANITQSIITKWIEKNQNYNSLTWQIDVLSKRIISWIANSKLSYDESDTKYKDKFNFSVNKQINHLINEISKSQSVNDKLLGCTATIIAGLSYGNEKFLNYGLELLRKIIINSFDGEYFPKTRSIRQLNFYLKYFVLVRELLKESFNDIPEYLDEIIFYLGKSYSVFSKLEQSLLFNGNHQGDLKEFNKYLALYKYKFENSNKEVGGYAILKNKNCILAMDVGNSPQKTFSNNYQSGALSFEFFYKDKKLISNSGYFQDYKNKLNLISKSTAAHSTLIIDNHSSCSFRINGKYKTLENGLKISDKNIVNEKNYWLIKASHNGFLKKFGILHERSLEYFVAKNKLIGTDKIIPKNKLEAKKYDIRFHMEPGVKLTKTLDNKTILIEIENSGWKFSTNCEIISIESGIYFGNKNLTNENQNICLSGKIEDITQEIKWVFEKIQ